MSIFERKTIHSMQVALGLAGFGYLGFVAGLIWPFANYLGFASLAAGVVLLLIKKTDLDRLRSLVSGFGGHSA